MKTAGFIGALMLSAAFAPFVQAAEKGIETAAENAVSAVGSAVSEIPAPATEITIYNQNLALIKKSQKATLVKGVNEIVFNEVAEQMRPESAFIFGDGVRILEQNYDYAGVNYMNMLNAYVGKEVKTVRTNPASGENVYEKAVLLAADGVSPVLKFDYGIETNFPGRVLFDKVPLGLNSTPVLKAKVDAVEAGEKELKLVYLTSGFSWEANYVAKVNSDKTLSLLGRVSLNNSSGSAFDNVSVNLMAGDVNTVNRIMQPRVAGNVMLMSVRAAGADMAMAEGAPVIDMPQNLNGYYIYKIPQPTSLKDGQIKQVSFVNASEVKYQRQGVINSPLSFGREKTFYKDVHPDLIYTFANNRDDGLGQPLPEGKISFYDYDKNGALQFIGENRLNNTAEGQKLTFKLGRFFDVYAAGNVDAIQKISERKYKKNQADRCVTAETANLYTVSYTVTNKGRYDAEILLKQNIPAAAKIVKESKTGEAGEGNEHVWKLTVAPNAEEKVELTLEGKVETRDCGLVTQE